MAHRPEKFASTLRQAVADILSRESLNPGLRRAVVVRAELSRDLKRATLFVACPAGSEAELLAQLRRSTGFVKKRLAGRMILRSMPEIEFALDTAGDFERRLAGMEAAADHEAADR